MKATWHWYLHSKTTACAAFWGSFISFISLSLCIPLSPRVLSKALTHVVSWQWPVWFFFPADCLFYFNLNEVFFLLFVGCSNQWCVLDSDNYGMLWGVLPIWSGKCGNVSPMLEWSSCSLWEPNLATLSTSCSMTADVARLNCRESECMHICEWGQK